MGNVVNIQIQNNCGCCDGGSSGSSGPLDPVIDGEFTSIDNPPEGYSIASGIEDRQCRVAIWLYDFLYYSADRLGNTTEGYILLTTLKTVSAGSALQFILRPLVVAILGAMGVTFPPSSPVVALIGFAIVSAWAAPTTETYTQKLFQDMALIIQKRQNDIICALSKASEPYAAEKALDRIFEEEPELSTAQKTLLQAFSNNTMLKILFWKPDWWPSFDEDYLTGITANCCGSFIDGQPLLPSGVEGCQTAWWITDKLIATIQGVQSFYSDHVRFSLADTDQFLEWVEEKQTTYFPIKVIEKATSKDLFFSCVAGYTDMQSTTNPAYQLLALFDTTWGELATNLTSQHGSIRTGLQAALSEQDVYNALYNPIEAWVTANITDVQLGQFITNGVKGLIAPTGNDNSFCNMMFFQDADLSFYADADCSGSGGTDPADGNYQSSDCGFDVAVAEYDFAGQQFNWVASAEFGQVLHVPGNGYQMTPYNNFGSTFLIQQVPHSVRRVRVTFVGPNADGLLGHLKLSTSPDGVTWTQAQDYLYPTSPFTFNAICADTRYIRVNANFTSNNVAWLRKIEYIL